jgi:hypothetical protein
VLLGFRPFCRLAAHLDKIEFDVSLVTTEWFLCLFAKSLPSETTMRVWDVMFNEGANTLCLVALAIFKMKEEELIRTKHVGEVMKVLHDATDHAYDPDELLKVLILFSFVFSPNFVCNICPIVTLQGQVCSPW